MQSWSVMGASGKSYARSLTSTAYRTSLSIMMPVGVARDRREGHSVYFGDASDLKFLEKCGLQKAAGVIITIHFKRDIDKVVEGARSIRPDLLIVSRARDADHARHLYAIGATDAVPETIEASLQLSEAALVRIGDWPPDQRSPQCTKREMNSVVRCNRQP